MTARAFSFDTPEGKAGIFGLEPIPVNAWWHPELRLLIDTGYRHDTAWLRDSNIRPEAILVTHHHPDHDGGLAEALAAFPGARFLSAQPEKIVSTSIERAVEGLRLGDGRIEVLATPGHTRPHVSLYDHDARAFYAGDLILAVGTPAAGPPEGSFLEYMQSLERVLKLAPKLVYPGHGPACGIEQVQWTYNHRLARLDDVIAALKAKGPATIAALVDRVYGDAEGKRFSGLQRVVAEMTMQGYVDVLVGQGRVIGDPTSLAWRAT